MKRIIAASGIFLLFSLFYVLSVGKVQAEGPLQVPVVTCEERLSNNTFVVGITVKWITPLKLSTYAITYQFFNLSTREVYAFANANPRHPNSQVFQIDNEVNVSSGTVIAGKYRIIDKYGVSDWSPLGTVTCTKGLPTPMPTVVPTNTPTPMSTQTPGVTVQTFNYPIKELGNCKDKEDCKKYCDLDENFNVCNEYAVKMGLRTREEAERLRNARNVKSGPGGCKSQSECEAFCSKTENREECSKFAPTGERR